MVDNTIKEKIIMVINNKKKEKIIMVNNKIKEKLSWLYPGMVEDGDDDDDDGDDDDDTQFLECISVVSQSTDTIQPNNVI